MLIAERFLLLALDPVNGVVRLPRSDTDMGQLCAAGLLLELIAQHRVQFGERGISLESALPPNHPLLEASCHALPEVGETDVATALSLIEHRMRPLQRSLLDSLFRRDFLHRVRTWRFWDPTALRYPLRSIQARNEAIAHLNEAALRPRASPAGFALLLLADVAGLLPMHLDAAHHEQASSALVMLNRVSRDDPAFALAAVRTALLA
ncbi:MAG: GPP34 family phosphoprotein [Tahibacter sp.]